MLQTRNKPAAVAPFERLHDLLAAAKAEGADAAEAVFAESRSLSVGVRKGELEAVERDETADLGLRVFVGRKQAVVSVSEFSPQTLKRLVERAVAMASLAPEDPYASLADPAFTYRADPSEAGLQIYDDAQMAASLCRRASTVRPAASIARARSCSSAAAICASS